MPTSEAVKVCDRYERQTVIDVVGHKSILLESRSTATHTGLSLVLIMAHFLREDPFWLLDK